MKILFFVSEFPKLSETFILNQIIGLVDSGHDIHIIAKYPEDNGQVHEDIKKYNLLNKVYYYQYGQEGSNRVIKIFKMIRDISLHFWKVYTDKNYKGTFSLGNLIKNRELINLIRLCNKIAMDYDVVYAHFGPNGLLAKKLIDKDLIKGDLFVSFHGYDVLGYVEKKGINIYNDLFTSSTLLPISEFWKDRLISYGAKNEDIVIHHMGVDLNKFSYRPIVINKSRIKIISVARLVEKKGIEYGIKAISSLIKMGYNIEYSIIGGGPLESHLKDVVKKEEINDFVKFLGWKTQDDVIDLIIDSNILLLPSITSSDGDMEGIPVILMEAMAVGTIVVSTYHSGIPELIETNKSGYLVEEKNPNNLAEILENILNKSEYELNDITERARIKIEEQFDVNLLNKQLVSLFKRCV